MSRRPGSLARCLTAAAAASFGVSAKADTLILTNGRVIEADRAWVEGSQVRYEKDGGVYGLPRSIVKSLEQWTTDDRSDDPNVARARDLMQAGDFAEAFRAATAALSTNPRSLPALCLLASAQLALGDSVGGKGTALRALQVEPKSPRARAVLADALRALGDRAGAEEQYRRSLSLHPDPAVEKRLAEMAPRATPPPPPAAIRIKFDGGVNEELGNETQRALLVAHAEFVERLGFRPPQAVTVVLELSTGLTDARMPDWAEGWNDGTIRIPAQGLAHVTPRMGRVLRHELAHSFVASRTGRNCPTWLQEGIAQWLEGGDPHRDDPALASFARAGALTSLAALEGPFRVLDEAEATRAYAESLSAVAHILDNRGEAGLRRLLAALGDGLPMEEAMPVALGSTYPELQDQWAGRIRTADRAPSPGPGSRF